VVEPIQGKGVHVAPEGFLVAAQQLLSEHGALLICDEVQTRIGRTGRFFGYQHEGLVPDIVTIAKNAFRWIHRAQMVVMALFARHRILNHPGSDGGSVLSGGWRDDPIFEAPS
jgi:4-aminobutyrate aminotransferase-like enzyme